MKDSDLVPSNFSKTVSELLSSPVSAAMTFDIDSDYDLVSTIEDYA